MAKSSGSSTTTNGTWTSTQAYVLAVICLLVGIAMGYLVRGSATPESTTTTAAAQPSGMPAGTGQQPTPEQMKRMADKQAEPLLAQLKSSPSDSALLAQIGNVYYDAQVYKEAVDYYDRSLKVDPKNANVRTDMGTAYYYMGDSDRALQEFSTTLQYAPKHAQTLFNVGMVKWQGKGDATGAVEAWQRLLQVAPDYPDRAKVQELIERAKQHSNIAPGTKTNKPATM
jgi:cytochrome c-type biogenesis protein CcmH/NrfG